MDGPPLPPKYLEDLQVGDRFVSATHALSAADIKAFARAFDPQPFHLDETTAAATFFGGLAASGWHTAAITMRLLVGSVPMAGGLVGAGGEVAWPRPTRPGDILRVESEITEVRPSRSRADRGSVSLRSTTLNQRGEAVQVFVARLVVPRRPPGVDAVPGAQPAT